MGTMATCFRVWSVSYAASSSSAWTFLKHGKDEKNRCWKVFKSFNFTRILRCKFNHLRGWRAECFEEGSDFLSPWSDLMGTMGSCFGVWCVSYTASSSSALTHPNHVMWMNKITLFWSFLHGKTLPYTMPHGQISKNSSFSASKLPHNIQT